MSTCPTTRITTHIYSLTRCRFSRRHQGSTIWPTSGQWGSLNPPRTEQNETVPPLVNDANDPDYIPEKLDEENDLSTDGGIRPTRNAPPPSKYRDSVWHKIRADSVSVPKSHDEAIKSPFQDQWREAEQAELLGLKSYGAYEVQHRGNNKPIELKWYLH